MDIKLQKQLYEKYPKIFRQHSLPMTDTCMCWGIECGDGWYSLIDHLCSWLQWSNYNSRPQVEASQVKEKFGGLRFYIDGGDEWQDGAISFAESISFIICETCGDRGELRSDHGWLSTLCDKCYVEISK